MKESRYYPIEEERFEREIEPNIKKYQKPAGREPSISHYEFFCAALYVLRTGIPWREMPKCYGKWHTIYMRFKRWSENGLFWNLLKQLQQKKRIKVDCSWVDSTTVVLHRHGSGSLKKRPSVCGKRP